MGVIFALSATPSLASPFEPIYDFILRKLAHVTVYAVLTILVYRALQLHLARPTHAWLLVMLIAALYACSDEWHQTFVPGRVGSVRDVAIDGLGIMGALALASLPHVRDVLRRQFAEEVQGIRP
jgi:VanZ family protein